MSHDSICDLIKSIIRLAPRLTERPVSPIPLFQVHYCSLSLPAISISNEKCPERWDTPNFATLWLIIFQNSDKLWFWSLVSQFFWIEIWKDNFRGKFIKKANYYKSLHPQWSKVWERKGVIRTWISVSYDYYTIFCFDSIGCVFPQMFPYPRFHRSGINA